MNETDYAAWKLRQQILADSDLDAEIVRHALIVVESVDWHTGVKTFTSKKHYLNWLEGLARKYDVRDEPTFGNHDAIPATEVLERYGVQGLVDAGYATFENGVLTLTLKDEW